MTKKKRRVFDIDFDDAATDAAEAVPAGTSSERRGPMATAISETADALSDRAETEAAIRAENDRLAHEHVRLKKLGLITDLIPVDQVRMEKLIRDRSAARDPDLEELMTSISEVGLSNPIRVEQVDDGYELIQGYRRLMAFKALLQKTGDQRYARIPAALVPRGESVESLYRKMVDENLVRRDISFAEMAQLAKSYGDEMGVDYPSAIATLYTSAGRQKKIYIRNFVHVLHRIGDSLRFPEAMPRALGLQVHAKLEADREAARRLEARLDDAPAQTPEAELTVLRNWLTERPEAAPRPSSAKTTLRLARPDGEAKCQAADGKLTVQVNRDFTAMDRRGLESAIRDFLDQLDRLGD